MCKVLHIIFLIKTWNKLEQCSQNKNLGEKK